MFRPFPQPGIRQRHCFYQGLGIWVQGPLVKFFTVGYFDGSSQVHHHHPVADMPNDSQIMRDKHQRQSHVLLNVHQQVHDLGLN
jgi:hypothetical protein